MNQQGVDFRPGETLTDLAPSCHIPRACSEITTFRKLGYDHVLSCSHQAWQSPPLKLTKLPFSPLF